MRIWLFLAVLLALPGLAQAQSFGDTLVPQADVTVTTSPTLVAAADGERVALNCTNNDASIHVRWGGSTVTTTTGQRIPAGAAIEIRTIGAVYMVAESSTAAVSCTTERR